MKTRSLNALFTAVAMLMAPILHAQSGFLDRLKARADEIADTADDIGQDVDTVVNADEVAADRVDSAGRQVELEAEHDVRDTVGATAPVSAARSAERDVLAAEAEADRIAATDERAANAVQSGIRETERALDVESRAAAEVAASEPVVATREAESDLRDADRAAARIGQADDLAEAEARRQVDPRPELEDTGNALQRARRSFGDLD
jgi:hypothetical protein